MSPPSIDLSVKSILEKRAAISDAPLPPVGRFVQPAWDRTFAHVGWTPSKIESFTLGLIHKFMYRPDLVGIAFNKGSPPDSSLRDQTSVEAFWRFRFSQSFAITPSIQLLADPALNPVDDKIWVWGARFGLTF